VNKLTILDWKLVKIPVLLTAVMDFAVIVLCTVLFPGNKDAWIFAELAFPFCAVCPGIFYLGELWQHSSLTELLLSGNPKLRRMMLIKYLCFLLAFSFLQEIAAAILCLPFDFSNGILFLQCH
jgi:hypothetical protein